MSLFVICPCEKENEKINSLLQKSQVSLSHITIPYKSVTIFNLAITFTPLRCRAGQPVCLSFYPAKKKANSNILLDLTSL